MPIGDMSGQLGFGQPPATRRCTAISQSFICLELRRSLLVYIPQMVITLSPHRPCLYFRRSKMRGDVSLVSPPRGKRPSRHKSHFVHRRQVAHELLVASTARLGGLSSLLQLLLEGGWQPCGLGTRARRASGVHNITIQ